MGKGVGGLVEWFKWNQMDVEPTKHTNKKEL